MADTKEPGRITVDVTDMIPQGMKDAMTTHMNRLSRAQDRLNETQEAYERAAQAERVALEDAKAEERAARDSLFALMESNRIDTSKDAFNTAVVVQRHDYVIEDEDDLRDALDADFDGAESFRTWDMAKLKELASKTRRTRGYVYRGMLAIPKRYLQVTPKGGAEKVDRQ